MRKVSSLFVAILALVLLSPGIASAQTFSSSSITIGNGYFGFSLQEFDSRTGNGISVHIGNGRGGNYTGIHIQNNRHQWRGDGFQYRQRRFVQPPVRRVQQSIQIVVIESRQVREPIYVYDRYGNLCATGQYDWVWRDFEVHRTAHWDDYHRAYVYYGSDGQPYIYRR